MKVGPVTVEVGVGVTHIDVPIGVLDEATNETPRRRLGTIECGTTQRDHDAYALRDADADVLYGVDADAQLDTDADA